MELAANAAGLEDGEYRLRYYPPQKSIWEELLNDIGGGYEESRMKSKLGKFYPVVKKIRSLQHYQGLQARLPFDITIE